MGRPKGSTNKKKEVIEKIVPHETIKEVKEVVNAEGKEVKKEKKIDVLALAPLSPGLAYFEAPDGTILTGEDTRNEIWYRAGNNGKGCWINRKR